MNSERFRESARDNFQRADEALKFKASQGTCVLQMCQPKTSLSGLSRTAAYSVPHTHTYLRRYCH